MRNEVSVLIHQLREACRRPLFSEIHLGEQRRKTGSLQGAAAVSPVSNKLQLDTSSDVDSQQTSKRATLSSQTTDTIVALKTWKELLRDASRLLPAMTPQEHGEVSRLAAILFLGFILPHSTGNEFFLLQNAPATRISEEDNNMNEKNEATTSSVSSTVEYILHMDLEERIESSCRHYSAHEFGEFDTITDTYWEVAWDQFLQQGLAPFLSGRPSHTEQVDLIHLLAMAIHPHPFAEHYIPETAHLLTENRSWKRSLAFMKSLHPQSFHINYGHRLKLVQLVTQRLVLPNYDPNEPVVSSPLFDGAIHHLRASLHSFAGTAMSMSDAHWAHCALVTITTQSRVDIAMKEEWALLLDRLVVDRTVYRGCGSCRSILRTDGTTWCSPLSILQSIRENGDQDASFCPHAARGRLLVEYLTRACDSRHWSEDELVEAAFTLVMDAVEWQMNRWRRCSNEESNSCEDPTCILASLLFVAKTFLYVLPVSKSEEEEGDANAQLRRDDLIFCAVQLVHHWDRTIVEVAAELLVLALAYGPPNAIVEYVIPLFESLKMCFADENTNNPRKDPAVFSAVQTIAAAVAHLSPHFSVSFVGFLIASLERELAKPRIRDQKKETATAPMENKSGREADRSKEEDPKLDHKQEKADPAKHPMAEGKIERPKTEDCKAVTGQQELTDDKGDNFRASKVESLLNIVVAMSMANPVVVSANSQGLLPLLGRELSVKAKLSVLAVLMSHRQGRFFAQNEGHVEKVICTTLHQINDRWSRFKIARHALLTGNYQIASELYHYLLGSDLSEKHNLWITVLANVADSEDCLARNSALGIPPATIALREALLHLNCLAAFCAASGWKFSFQRSFVELRVDFLDLLTALRQLIREMRLTGSGPAKRTRPNLHFQNLVKCFDALAGRYLALYRLHGLFLCQQSRTGLRTAQAVCRFMAHTTRVVFSDIVPANKKDDVWPGSGPAGDPSLPCTRFMQQLVEQLIPRISTAIEPVIRAAAMLEVIDGILLCPFPYPRAFVSVKSIPCSTLALSGDPEQVGDECGDDDAGEHRDDLSVIDAYPGISFSFYVSGMIPELFIAQSKLKFSVLMICHSAFFTGPLQDDDHGQEDKQDDEAPVPSNEQITFPQPWNSTLVVSRLPQCGNFFVPIECPPIREEGNYRIDVNLVIRDLRGGEWDIPVNESCRKSIQVQVSRSVE